MEKTLLITMDFPPMTGGVANYWANLCRQLPPNDLVVLAEEYDNSLDFDIKQNYLIYRKNLINKNQWSCWPKWRSFLFETIKIVRREKIKKIIVAQVLPGGTIAYFIKKFLGVPYILSFHGLDLALAQQNKRKKFILKKIIKSAYKIIVNSNYTKQQLLALNCCEEEKITIVYPCPNITQMNCDEQKMQELIDERGLAGKQIILTVSRLVKRKGHENVIMAMPEILKMHPSAMYVIVGRGEYQEQLEKLIFEKKLFDQIKIFSDVKDEELPCFYELSKVFVMPSTILKNGDVEGFGIVYLEAALYQKPVIAGRCGGAPEAVLDQKTGILVDPNSVKEISEALVKLLFDYKLAQSLGEAGRQRVESYFTWQKQAQKLFNIL